MSHGIAALAINSNRISAAREVGIDLWIKARVDVSILCLSPEQLISKGFADLLEHKPFADRYCILGVDEIHLLYSWGQSFRLSLKEIKYVRARGPSRVVMCGVSATVADGEVMDTVCDFLGFRPGKFHLIRRSNARPDVQLLIRELQVALGGWIFPQLDWIFDRQQKTLIFCPTIALEFRVTVYLWRAAIRWGKNPKKLMRMYNALNWPEYNTETLDLMHNDPDVKILLSTDCLCVGFNCKHICDVIIMGETKDMDEYVQKTGRPGRDPSVVRSPRGIMYVTKKAVSVAKEVSAGKAPKKNGPKDTVAMDPGIAALLESTCLPTQQDRHYGNTSIDPPCTCEKCSTTPPATGRDPCNCSKCTPEHLPALPPRKRQPVIPMAERLTEDMRALASERLIAFRKSLWKQADEVKCANVPRAAFLPEHVIKHILDNYAMLGSANDLHPIIATHEYLVNQSEALWSVLVDLRAEFVTLRAKADAEKEAAKRAKLIAAKHPVG